METWSRLLLVEMRRALHRRIVWVLLAIALVGVMAMGLVAFFESAGKTVASMRSEGQHPALLERWWVAGGDSVLGIAVAPLLIGALVGGASVAGAEWRAGTVTTVLAWEPRRARLHAARMCASFVLAALIAFGLQLLLLASALPAVLAHGSTAGTDGEWWLSLLAAMARVALLTGAAALLSGSLATLGRSTSFAIGAVFVWLAVLESLVRGLLPSLQRLLLGENMAIVLTWSQLDAAEFRRSTALAALTAAGYVAVVAAAAWASFVRRDVASAA